MKLLDFSKGSGDEALDINGEKTMMEQQ